MTQLLLLLRYEYVFIPNRNSKKVRGWHFCQKHILIMDMGQMTSRRLWTTEIFLIRMSLIQPQTIAILQVIMWLSLTKATAVNIIILCHLLGTASWQSFHIPPKTLEKLIESKAWGFVCLFCCFTSQFNSYGHGGTVSSPNHTFSWAGLNKRLTSNSCTYFRL